MEFQDMFLEWEADNPFDATEPARHFQSEEEYQDALQSYNDHRLYSFGKYVYENINKINKNDKPSPVVVVISIVCATLLSSLFTLILFGVL